MLRVLKKLAIVLVWLLIWQLASALVAKPILLCSPLDVFWTLLSSLFALGFWSSIAYTMGRICLGFFSAFFLGMVLGALSWRFRLFAEFFNPAMLCIKSVPIVCFVVLLLIWFGSAFVSAIAVFLVVLPAVYFPMAEGLRSHDKKLLAMLRVFRVPIGRQALSHYWSAIAPFITASSRITVGLSWKSGVAAELIGLPLNSIGEGIYQSKITLSSADLFAWTIVIIAAALASEKVFLFLLKQADDWLWRLAMPRFHSKTDSKNMAKNSTSGSAEPEAVVVQGLDKCFGDNIVLKNFNVTLQPGSRYLLMGSSGKGKTTLLMLLAGVILPDHGSISTTTRTSVVFQEARLFESRSAVENIQLVAGKYLSASAIREMLSRVLPDASLDIEVCQLSGGMRRRVELCRALAMPADLLLLDEPFAGLDAASKAISCRLLLDSLGQRTLVLSSHNREEAGVLSALILKLPDNVGQMPTVEHWPTDTGQ
ncbi:MAG: ATP-binding cassette domain-containing protein [Actinomycetia bacterium]|nr:ATP-binding cassette domain-containing protein [Actinomycetes bacterium]